MRRSEFGTATLIVLCAAALVVANLADSFDRAFCELEEETESVELRRNESPVRGERLSIDVAVFSDWVASEPGHALGVISEDASVRIGDPHILFGRLFDHSPPSRRHV